MPTGQAGDFNQSLMDPDVASDPKRLRELSTEVASAAPPARACTEKPPV